MFDDRPNTCCIKVFGLLPQSHIDRPPAKLLYPPRNHQGELWAEETNGTNTSPQTQVIFPYECPCHEDMSHGKDKKNASLLTATLNTHSSSTVTHFHTTLDTHSTVDGPDHWLSMKYECLLFGVVVQLFSSDSYVTFDGSDLWSTLMIIRLFRLDIEIEDYVLDTHWINV